jgi:hypothetical protein
MKSIKQHNSGGCSVGVIDGTELWSAVKMASGGMIYIPSFMKTDSGIKVILCLSSIVYL